MNILDLAQRDTALKRVSTANGGEFAGPCPLCGGTDRFRVWPETNRYWCRQCQAKGDVIQYLRDFRGMSYPDAAKAVGKVLDPLPPPSNSPWDTAADAILALTQERAEFHLRWPLAQAKLTEMAHLPDQWSDTAKVEALNEWMLLLDWDKALRRIEEKIWERCESILAP